MTLPRRIRLLQVCKTHLYNEVKQTLATDKELRSLHGLNTRIEKAFVNLTKPRKRHVFCEAKCGFADTFETDEYGLSYFQAVGTCPNCNAFTVYKNGQRTKVEMTITINH